MKDLYFFLGHLDDFEISCIGFLYENHKNYDNIKIVIASQWESKKYIWKNNLKEIEKHFGIDISYVNLGFDQRTLMTNFDDVKDKFYTNIDFNNRFDIVTHDLEDCHTDHVACNMIANGMFKYTSSFYTVYSPSSRNFKANYWIALPDFIYSLKKKCVDKYDISNEQSYSRLGYYIQSEVHYNIGMSYHLENFVHQDSSFYETYRILKMSK